MSQATNIRVITPITPNNLDILVSTVVGKPVKQYHTDRRSSAGTGSDIKRGDLVYVYDAFFEPVVPRVTVWRARTDITLDEIRTSSQWTEYNPGEIDASGIDDSTNAYWEYYTVIDKSDMTKINESDPNSQSVGLWIKPLKWEYVDTSIFLAEIDPSKLVWEIITADDGTQAATILYAKDREETGVTPITGEVKIPDTYMGLPVTSIRTLCEQNSDNGSTTGVRGISYIKMSDNIRTTGANVFWGAGEDLTRFDISKNLEYIVDRFLVNAGISSIDIPESVTSIGSQAFYRCRSLHDITINGRNTTIEPDAFNVSTIKSNNGFIKGYIGSPAETYAVNNGITFISL